MVCGLTYGVLIEHTIALSMQDENGTRQPHFRAITGAVTLQQELS